MHDYNSKYRICTRGIWDTTVPGITFDNDGISNYANMFDRLCKDYPRGEKGKKFWEDQVKKMKGKGNGKRYDCIIGVSGGTDSCYLLHLAKKEYNLRPLAVNLDNGWSSEIAVQNIRKVTKALDIDLETYVIDYEEVKVMLRSYMKASLPWIDGPTDHAIMSILFKIAEREDIKFILIGSDFRTEGKQPSEWTYTDSKQMLSIIKLFDGSTLKSFPYQNLFNFVKSTTIKDIKFFSPFNSIDYQKKKAQVLLENTYGWEYYGGHHHENMFTKFAISYWMPKKFNIDKRIITLSAQILSGEISRTGALELMKQPPYDPDLMERDKAYVLKKLDLTPDEFILIWKQPNNYYWDYPSYMPIFEKYMSASKTFLKYFLPKPPTMSIEKQYRHGQS